MAFNFKVEPNQPDRHESHPHWFAAFVRLKFRDSFNHDRGNPRSTDEALANPVAEDELMIVSNDILNFSTSSAKGSHVSQLALRLEHSETDYGRALAPDDWVMFWAFDNKADYLACRAKVERKAAANAFAEGLKFVGRVDSVRRTKVREPNAGLLNVQYSVTCVGFSEFDSTIYYNPALAFKEANVFQFMPNFGVQLDQFVLDGQVNPQTAIPRLLQICLGEGPQNATGRITKEAAKLAGLSEAGKKAAAQIQPSPNRAYRIPTTVAQLLGARTPTRAAGFTYSDIVRRYIGIQRYASGAVAPEAHGTYAPAWLGLLPRLKEISPGGYSTRIALDGQSLPYPLDFNKTTIWSILGTYLNAPVNEMYTCLRVDPNGAIMPSFVCRQLPLSSNNFIAGGGQGTAFLSLPRWVINTKLVQSIETGRSNAARFNYVYLRSQDQLQGTGNVTTGAEFEFSYNQPAIDHADIMRAGLRMFDQPVSGTVFVKGQTASASPGRRWTRMMADILMGGHLKYSGTISLEGIQAPIVEGDNCVVDGIVYHIERISHSGGVDPMGRRTFMTSLNVTNGISIESDKTSHIVYPDLDIHGDDQVFSTSETE